jgi:hypothetical protein
MDKSTVKRTLQIFFVFLFFHLSAPVSANTLWKNVRLGMTAKQVVSAQPKAEKHNDNDKLYGGVSCDYRIKEYKYAGTSFNVCFYFFENKLLQVTLKTNQPIDKLAYHRALKQMRKQYGKPKILEENNSRLSAVWGEIKGFHPSILSYPPRILNINFQNGPYPVAPPYRTDD